MSGSVAGLSVGRMIHTRLSFIHLLLVAAIMHLSLCTCTYLIGRFELLPGITRREHNLISAKPSDDILADSRSGGCRCERRRQSWRLPAYDGYRTY